MLLKCCLSTYVHCTCEFTVYVVFGVHTDPQNVLEFENYIQVPLHVLELMGVFLDVLQNIISMLLYISPTFWPYQLPMIL